MATLIDPLTMMAYDNLRAQKNRQAENARGFIDRIADGEALPVIPWENAAFREEVLAQLRKGEKWKRDAEKLAVIKEVFGGMR